MRVLVIGSGAREHALCWAAALGPKTRSPRAAKTSAMPPPRGSSGPTMVRSIAWRTAHSAQAAKSIGSSATFSARVAVPPLPGAQ